MISIDLKKFWSFDSLILLLFILIFCLFSYIPGFLNESIDNASVDALLKIRGAREIDNDIVIVFIGDDDIKALGGWPITRNYYAYLTHVLSSSGAKVIGYDILFTSESQHYAEYDHDLALFFKAAGNVCLPMAFSEIRTDPNLENPTLQFGISPVYPLKLFFNSVAGIGFSNFGNETIVRKVPLAVGFRNFPSLSFGCELARLYLENPKHIAIIPNSMDFYNEIERFRSIPIDEYNRYRVNHIGGVERFKTISLLELLKTYEETPDSLDVKDKLVVVAATASGIATLKTTPLANLLPAAFIHVTVAENIIHQNFLHESPTFIEWILILIFVIIARLLWQMKSTFRIVLTSVALLGAYWIIASEAFILWNHILPLFYPSIVFISAVVYLGIRKAYQQRLQSVSLQAILSSQVSAKELDLERAKVQLKDMQLQLDQETTISEQTRQLAEQRAEAILKLEKDLRDLKVHISPAPKKQEMMFAAIVHSNKSPMAAVLELVTKVSSDDIPVLILGETGTGKEIIAHAIHQTSKRKNAPFVAINCGALPETLLESELFGHEKGSFTGAHSRRRGRFELANGGTIFLDEITETTPAFQTRLLRVLQEGVFERLGGEQTIHVDVRVIAATNKNLQKEMENERFRTDLFYRLNGFPIHLPPLRERTDDIPLLAIHFLKKHCYKSVTAFSGQAIEIMQHHHWPGNVRELENLVRRAAILAQSEGRTIIQEGDLPQEVLKSKNELPKQHDFKPLEVQILDSLRRLKFSRSAISQTAKALGNRDRGTITEYFRGICFEYFVTANFDIDKATSEIAGSSDKRVIEQVKSKISEYITNLDITSADDEENEKKLVSAKKGLPKKYHPYLEQIIEHLLK